LGCFLGLGLSLWTLCRVTLPSECVPLNRPGFEDI
jgi:hypothetical protein